MRFPVSAYRFFHGSVEDVGIRRRLGLSSTTNSHCATPFRSSASSSFFQAAASPAALRCHTCACALSAFARGRHQRRHLVCSLVERRHRLLARRRARSRRPTGGRRNVTGSAAARGRRKPPTTSAAPCPRVAAPRRAAARQPSSPRTTTATCAVP